MSRRRAALRREIEALEADLDECRKPRRARRRTPEDDVHQALEGLKQAVKAACGPSYMTYMDEDEIDIVDESNMSYMDEDMDEMTYMDDDEMVTAEEGVEEDITQEYLTDVLDEVRDPGTIDTDESMLDTAESGYTARLKSASMRLDRVATYLEKQGRKKLAFRVDKIADAIDARIKQEESSDG